MDDCGPDHDKRNYKRVHAKIMDEIENGSTLVLPMATLIETGNLIAQANGDRYQYASGLADIIAKVAKEEEPWAAFTFQSKLWNEENLIKLSKEWPKLAAEKISVGDATIKNVAEYYAASGYRVEILTGDKGLKSYQPSQNIRIPRRRK